jgi:hypothetical protein
VGSVVAPVIGVTVFVIVRAVCIVGLAAVGVSHGRNYARATKTRRVFAHTDREPDMRRSERRPAGRGVSG